MAYNYQFPVIVILFMLTTTLASTIPPLQSLYNTSLLSDGEGMRIPLSELLQNTTTSRLSDGEGMKCSKTTLSRPRPLTVFDCAQAIHKLSTNQDIGSFHEERQGRPPDRFSLPISKVAERCEVEVRMNVHALRDSSSWFAVGQLANTLNVACNDKLKLRYGGGYAFGGDDRGIVVRLGPIARNEARGLEEDEASGV